MKKWRLVIVFFTVICASILMSHTVVLAENQPQQESPDAFQVMLVVDISGSMSLFVVPDDVPEELASLQAQLEAMTEDPEYIRLLQAYNGIFELPEVVAARENLADAEAALNDWVYENHYDTQEELRDMLEELGCNGYYAGSLLFVTSEAQIGSVVGQACQGTGVTPTTEDVDEFVAMLDYIESTTYIELNEDVATSTSAYNTAVSGAGVNAASSALQNYSRNVGLYDLQDEFQEKADDYGLSTRLEFAVFSIDTLIDISALDAQVTNREAPIGLVTFSDAATVTHPLNTDYDVLEEKLDALEPIALTNIGDGLLIGLRELEENMDPDNPAVLILLSDGVSNVGIPNDQILARVPPLANELDISICAVGFGENEADIDVELLNGLAEETGGKYIFADQAEEIAGFFVECRQNLLADALTQVTGIVVEGEDSPIDTVVVDAGTNEVTFALTYRDGRIIMEVVDPNGNVIDLDYENAIIEEDENVQYITITDPDPGEWEVRIQGENLPESGGVYNVTVSQQQDEAEASEVTEPEEPPNEFNEVDPTETEPETKPFWQNLPSLVVVGVAVVAGFGILAVGAVAVVIFFIVRKRSAS